MSRIGKPERVTQNRVVALFRDELGYRFLGDRSDRAGNSNIEEDDLSAYLAGAGYSPEHISRALHKLKTEATNPNRSLYDNNRAVYRCLRYGVDVRTEAGSNHDKIKLIDWEHPERNDFALAEEVTLQGDHERRPDLVLYLGSSGICAIIPASCCPTSNTTGWTAP